MPRWAVGCLGLLVVAALVVAVLVGAYSVNKASPTTQAYEQAMNELAIKDAAAKSEQASYLAWAVLPVAARVLNVLQVTLIVGLLTFSYALFKHNREVINVHGTPVARWVVLQGATIQTAHEYALLQGVAGVETARNPVPRLPDGLRTYQHAPRLTDATRHTAPALPVPPAMPTLPAPGVPTFAQLLTEGVIGRDGRLLLGYDERTQERLWGTWDMLYSAAIAGLQGAGKTTTVRFLIAQSAMLGADLAVIDPHANAEHGSLARTLAPLSPLFIAPPATTDDAIALLVATLRKELAIRKGGRGGLPLILAVDEWTALMRRSTVAPALSELVETIAEEGRKFGLYALLMGQNWTVEASGGSAVRDVLAASYIHRSKPQTARCLAPGIDGRKVLSLPPGHAILDKTDGERVEVVIPNTTEADLEAVRKRLGRGNGSGNGGWEVLEAPRPRLEVAKKEPAPAPSTPAVTSEPLDERATGVRQMIKDGKTATEIITALWGVKGGRAFGDAAREYQSIVDKLIP